MCKNDEIELRPRDLCGCGSGWLYKDCHQRTKKRYFRTSHGDIIFKVPMSKELVDTLKDSKQRFKKVFGRPPTNSDPVLWERTYLKGYNTIRLIAKTMREAQVPDEFIYAYQKTGLMIAEKARVYSKSEKQEFSDAVEEFLQLSEEGIDPFHRLTYLSATEYENFKTLKTLIKELAIVCDISCEYTFNKIKLTSHLNKEIYILASFKSVSRSIEFIATKITEEYSDECLIVARALIEHYLKIKNIRLNKIQTKSVFYGIMASAGTVPYATRRNGKIDFKRALDESGDPVDIAYSYSDLAKNTGFDDDIFIYEKIYKYLSNFVHRDISEAIIRSFTNSDLRRLAAEADDDEILGTYLCAVVIAIYVSEFLCNEWLAKQTIKDISSKLVQINNCIDTLEGNETIAALGL